MGFGVSNQNRDVVWCEESIGEDLGGRETVAGLLFIAPQEKKRVGKPTAD
jgi:hypothetical protein